MAIWLPAPGLAREGAAVAAWVLPSVPNGVLAAAITTVWAPVFFEEHHSLYLLAPWMVAVPLGSIRGSSNSSPRISAAMVTCS